MSKYKFHISLPTGEEEFFPANTSLKWTYKQEKDEIFFRKHLDTNIVIDNKALFNNIWEMYKVPCSCAYLDIRIEEKCCEVYKDTFLGRLAFVDGDWDVKNCVLEIKPRIQDEYSCLLNNWEKDRNFLEIVPRVDISTYEGTRVCTIVTKVERGNGVAPTILEAVAIAQANAPGIGWTVIDIGILTSINGDWEIGAEYCRMESSSPSNNDGWSQDGSVWVRPVAVNYNAQDSEPSGFVAERSMRFKTVNFSTDNGVKFNDFIDFYLADCFPVIKSNFFGINADSTNPNNIAYEFAEARLHELVCLQSFEIIDPDSDSVEGGTVSGLHNFKSIWKDLKAKFNVIMFFDNEEQCLRIEHISYLKSGKVLDLTANHKDYLTGKFSTDAQDIPFKELLTYTYDSGSVDFMGGNITYNVNCATNDDNLKERKHTIENFLNDVGAIYDNEDLIGNLSAMDNISMLSTKDGIINLDVGRLSGNLLLNGSMASANLISAYWLWNRPHCLGVVNGRSVFFNSTTPVKKHKAELPLSCSIVDRLNVNIDKVKTRFGECKIDEITVEDEDVSFNLKF